MKILIVDDDRDDADLLYDAVKEFSPISDCRVAQSVAAATALFSEFTPDVVFLDAIMYPTDGKELLRKFAGQSHLRHTRFVVIAGALQPWHHHEFIEMGAKSVIGKPSNYNFLKEIVEKFLRPSVVNIHAKLLTTDAIVHDQTSAIQDLLARDMQFDIELNPRISNANIQFVVSETELTRIVSELEYHMLYLQGGHWLPKV